MAPAAPADAGNDPAGRSDPGGPRLAGFPLWVWGVAAVGTFAVVWFMRNRTSAVAGQGTQTGAASGTNPDLGITTTDPMTMAALLAQMQEMAKRLGATSVSPAPSTTPAPGNSLGGPPVVSLNGGATTSHTSGGTSTNLITAPGIPSLAPPAVVVAALKVVQIPGVNAPVQPAVPTGYAATTVTVKPSMNIGPIIQRIISGPAAPVKVVVPQVANYNPIRPRTSGTQAVL